MTDVAPGAFYPAQRQALANAVEYAMGTGVAGDIVEFGCYLGLTAAMLAEAMAEGTRQYAYSDTRHGIPERRLWVFDSFEGFPEARSRVDVESPHIQAGVWFAGQPCGSTPAEVMLRCAEFIPASRIAVVKGWFADTLVQIPHGQQFAVIHVDCDYYESTRQALGYLFEHGMVSEGATILFDDWYCNRGSPDYGEQRAWHEAVQHYRVRFTDWGPYGVVGRRFIVHKGKSR